MPPPVTPRYRFPSPDDAPRPRSGPPKLPSHQFATPAPLRRNAALNSSFTGLRNGNRGFSPDPDFFTPSTTKVVKPESTGGKRRRSFDLDEIDEALLVSAKPKVLGPSSGGWRYPADYFTGTPVPQKTSIAPHATPTPSTRHLVLREQSSAIISSPPEGLNISFGDTQEDVQEDDSEHDEKGKGLPKRKKQRSVINGAFDDIESIASSLPVPDNVEDEEEEPDRKENDAPSKGLKTPPRLHKTFLNNLVDNMSTPAAAATPGEVWIPVPHQPTIKLPSNKSPTAKLNKAICAMAWSPSHRKRRNANNRYLSGGLAATVLGWAYDAQDTVLRNNAVLEQNPDLHQGSVEVEVDGVMGDEEGYAAVRGTVEGEEVGFVLIGDEKSAMRREVKRGARVEVRPPMWEITAGGEQWTVGINWRLRVT